MRIVVADSQSKVRFALCTLLRRRPGLEVVGEAVTAEELLAQVEAIRPDLVLLHWRLEEGGAELLTALRKVCPGLRVVVLSARPETCSEALGAGADAFVCKMDPPEKLLAAIEGVQLDHGQHRRRGKTPSVQPVEAAAPEGAAFCRAT